MITRYREKIKLNHKTKTSLHQFYIILCEYLCALKLHINNFWDKTKIAFKRFLVKWDIVLNYNPTTDNEMKYIKAKLYILQFFVTLCLIALCLISIVIIKLLV